MVQLEEKCRSYKQKLKSFKSELSNNAPLMNQAMNRENSAYTSIVGSSNLEVIPETGRYDEL